MNNSPIEIYQTEDGRTSIEVKLDNGTMWLSQSQIAELFQTDRTSIVRHINNIYKTKELSLDSTCAKFAQVRQEGKRQVSRQIPFYNLDVVISVGYRVNAKRGTQFRIWANNVLKDYLIKGYAVNQQRIDSYNELRGVLRLMSRTIAKKNKEVEESDYAGLFSVVRDYLYALDTLDRYDYQSLSILHTTSGDTFHITYDNAMEAVEALKEKYGGSAIFANEKDESFRSSVGQIYQTFDGKELYPSLEEKAAMLLYLVVKNHSFTDGNKRIAAMLFLWYLDKNGILYGPEGNKRIADNTLVALTLMIAESRIEEKDVMIQLVVNLINKDNM